MASTERSKSINQFIEICNSMSTKWKLILIFILAFLIRLGMNVVFQGLNSPPDPNMGADGLVYDLVAQNIAKGNGATINGIPSTYTIGPSFILVPIYYLFGVNYALARIEFSLLGAATCIIIYLIGKRLIDKKFGLFAALALALYPMHFYYSSHFLSEIPFTFFLSLSILYGVLLQQNEKIRYSVLFGIFCGLASYMKPANLAYLPIFVLLYVIYHYPIQKKRAINICLIPAIFFILSISPWVIRNYKVTGHVPLMTTHGGTTFLDGNNERAFTDISVMGDFVGVGELPEERWVRSIKNAYERERIAYKIAFTTIRRHLKDLPRLEIMKLYRLITPFYSSTNILFKIVGGISWGALLPFCVIGISATIRNRLYVLLHSELLLIIITTLIWFGCERYRESISPVLIIYGCKGFLNVALNLKERFKIKS